MKEIASKFSFLLNDGNVEVARDVAEVVGVVEIIFVLVGDDAVDGCFSDVWEEQHQ